MNLPLLGFLLAIVGIGAAQAQQTNPFIPSGNYTSLTAGATSTNVQLPANSPAIQLQNTGGTAVSCSFGMNSADAVATPLQLIVQPGGQKTVGVPQGMTWLACIDQTGSASNVVIVAGGNGSGSDVGSNVITTVPGGTQNVNIVSPLGSTVSAASIPVVIATDQAAVAVKQATAANLNATVVGTGTFAVQATDNLTQIGGASYALGSALSSASAPVVLASDQAAIAIKGAASNAGSGVATSSLNAPSIAYNYGFNGTTWDQLQVDASKNLKVTSSPTSRTLVTLNIKTVTTGGTAVVALLAGQRSAGGWIQNPPSATINLCINEIGTATGTTSSGDTTCITPGTTYGLAPSGNAVSVISSDSSHPFSGIGLQ